MGTRFMYWHTTDPCSDDRYGQPNNDAAACTGRRADFLPIVLLLGLLWHQFIAIHSSLRAKLDAAISFRRTTP